MIELILGGARSGKSRFAENRVLEQDKKPVYLATAEAGDSEMQARISHHRERRGSNWHTLEEPIKLAETLLSVDNHNHCVLVDCLTLWLSNCMLAEEACWERQRRALLACLAKLQSHVIMVSNEVGQGIVPVGDINRRFVDESGRLHQDIAAIADRVTLVTAGLPMTLKPA